MAPSGHLAIMATAAFIACGGMSRAPERPAPLPDACGMLRQIDTADILGPAPDFELSEQASHKGDGVMLTLCTGTEADGSRQITLMVVENDEPPGTDSAGLRRAYVEDISKELDKTLNTADIDIGEAAVWTEDFGQLTMWSHDARVMMIVSPHSIDDPRAAAETVAKRLASLKP